jgi:hypothetical protein
MHQGAPNYLSNTSVNLTILVLTVAALLFLFFLVVILETASLQLMRWGNFKDSLKSSFIINLASTPISFLTLAQVPKIGLVSVFIAWVFSVLIEWFILHQLGSTEKYPFFLVALIANLVSFVILILPSFLYTNK